MFILVFTIEGNVFAWTTDENAIVNHTTIITSAVNWSSLSFSNDNITIMKTTSNLADTNKWFDGINKNITGDTEEGGLYVHAAGNYVLSTRLLYEMALEIKLGNRDAIESIKIVEQRFLNSTLDISISQVSKISKTAQRLIWMDVIPNFSEQSNEIRAWKLLGFVAHLVGDTYAHRIMVPITAVEGTNPRIAEYSKGILGTDDFPTIGNCNHTAYELKYSAYSHSDDSDFRNFNCVQKAIFLGCIEFRDLKSYQIRLNNNMIYEDHPNFYPARHTLGSKWGTLKIINGLQLNEKFPEYTYAYDMWKNGTVKMNLRLNNLKNYYIQSGVPTNDSLEHWANAWPQITTNELY